MSVHALGISSGKGNPLFVPRALLIDFGGVLVDGPAKSAWHAGVAAQIGALLGRESGATVPDEVLAAGLRYVEKAADEEIRQGREGTVWTSEFWGQRLADVLPQSAAASMVPHVEAVARWVAEAKYGEAWVPRAGVDRLLRAAHSLGLPMAIVSNAIRGTCHRDVVARAGWSQYFIAQIYSDEVGIRKPNPAIIWFATEKLCVDPGGCWFVGDSISRDVQAARKAGCGGAVLMQSMRPSEESVDGGAQQPDVRVKDPTELLEVLLRALGVGDA